MKNFKFIINGNNYEVNIKHVDNNFADVEVNGTTYSVEAATVAEQKVKSNFPDLPTGISGANANKSKT